MIIKRVNGCRNGAKFSILKSYSYSPSIHIRHLFIHIQHLFIHIQQLFIHIQHLFIHIQHLYVFSININSSSTFMFIKLHLHSTIIFIENVTFIFCSQFYPFKSFLSIQQFFILSTIKVHLLLCMEVRHFLQPINWGSCRSRGILIKIMSTFQVQPYPTGEFIILGSSCNSL